MGKKIVAGIDWISTWIGKVVAWVVIVNILALVYEFFARYVFGSPTIWAYEATYFLYGTHFLLGAGYTLFVKSHVRIDIFYQRVSPRAQASLDTIGYLLFFFPVMMVLAYAGAEFTYQSFEMGERSGLSPWRPYLYPYKGIIFLSIFFLLLQGVAEFLRSATLAIRGKTR
jgi:TRAP-type mannitol/chloroaromatic compound transport system permease small subunit